MWIYIYIIQKLRQLLCWGFSGRFSTQDAASDTNGSCHRYPKEYRGVLMLDGLAFREVWCFPNFKDPLLSEGFWTKWILRPATGTFGRTFTNNGRLKDPTLGGCWSTFSQPMAAGYFLTTMVGIVLAYAVAAVAPNMEAANALLPTYVTTCLYFGLLTMQTI